MCKGPKYWSESVCVRARTFLSISKPSSTSFFCAQLRPSRGKSFLPSPLLSTLGPQTAQILT